MLRDKRNRRDVKAPGTNKIRKLLPPLGLTGQTKEQLLEASKNHRQGRGVPTDAVALFIEIRPLSDHRRQEGARGINTDFSLFPSS